MPDATPPPRSPRRERLRMQTGYHWRNSANAAVVTARTAWDTRDRARFPVVRSEAGGVSVTYAGLTEGLAYTLEFTEERRGADPHRADRRSWRQSGAELRSPGGLPPADVVVLGTSESRARALPSERAFVMPMRVHFVVDYDTGPAGSRPRASRRERWQFQRNLREHAWQWELDGDPAWFDHFYDHFYRPTMRRRHGSRERTESKEVSYECLFRSGRMFVLSQRGERVGGALCRWEAASKTLTLRLLGVAGGAQEHYRSGAFKAIYHFLLEWCRDHGVRRLDFQGTEPFLSKGTFQWKRRLGARVVLPPNHFGGKRLWFRVCRDTPSVRDFLVANPLLTIRPGGSLEAVYFRDAHRPPRFDYSAKSPGVTAIREVDLDAFLASAPVER